LQFHAAPGGSVGLCQGERNGVPSPVKPLKSNAGKLWRTGKNDSQGCAFKVRPDVA